jgi:hypothetical protein
MIKPKLLVVALAVILFFTKAHAQTDTSYYDLGRIHLKKDFTQGVTVKGEDLEKMPFTNLADALNVWFYGTYSNQVTLVYIIDGNLVNDVNAYSIYDIDEATLIQNAVANISGAAGPEQLVLIKTKRADKKGFGITANAQADISSMYTNNNILNAQTNTYQTGLKTTTTLYQQYYISAYKNTDKINFGISADYLKDIMPVINGQGFTYPTPLNFDRLKFNTYLDVKLGNSSLDVTASYNKQNGGQTYNEYSNSEEFELNDVNKSHIFDGTISLTTPIAHGFTNVVHGDYNYLGGNDAGEEIVNVNDGVSSTIYKSNNVNYNFVAYDNLSYIAKFGNWTLEPAVNLNFRTFKDSTYNSDVAYENGDLEGNSFNYESPKEHLFLLTPSVSLSYKSYFNIQGGFLDDLTIIGAFPDVKPKKILPFATASANVMRLINPNSTLTIKVYGSYAVNDLFTDNFNLILPFSLPSVQVPLIGSINDDFTESYYGVDVYKSSPEYLYYGNAKTFKTVSAGIDLSPPKSGLTFSYYFQKSNYLSPIYVYEPADPNSIQIVLSHTNTNLILNRLSVSYKLSESNFSWRTNLNATMMKQTYPEINFTPEPSLGGGKWTGGWVNRLMYHDFSAEVDVLYQFGEKAYTEAANGGVVTNNINSFSLQNLYVGYRLKIKGLKNPEVFANARNIFQNKKADITDNRKYYGLGINLSL